MSCCQTLSSIAKACGGTMGGIKQAYVTCWSNTLVSDKTSTAITFPSGTCWYSIEFFKETSNFVVDSQFVEGRYAAYFQGNIELVISKLSAANNTTIQNLQQSDLAVIITDNNGQNWLFGVDYPAIATAGSAASGTAFTDPNAYTLTITSSDLQYPLSIPQSSITLCS